MKAMKWMKAEGAVLEDGAEYLVKTNAGEWGDRDHEIMRPAMIRFRMSPHYVRGRPVWVARITDPEGATMADMVNAAASTPSP